jgi:hypothetical protein
VEGAATGKDGRVAATAFDRRHVLAYRAHGQGLAERRPRGGLLAAVGAIGLRRTRHTLLSLAARVEEVTGDDLARALDREELVVVYGPRGTKTVVPVGDVAVFTAGVLPADEASLRAAVPGAYLRRLDAAGLAVTDALAQVVGALRGALAGGPRSRGETVMAVSRALPEVLVPPCRGRCPDPHVEDSLYRLAGVAGTMRFVGDSDDLVAVAEVTDRDAARCELVRRYLRCHGPSTAAAFAEWAGISVADARQSLGDGTVVVEADDCAGVRFLPAYDPWLLDRDRATLVPDAAARRLLWRPAANPGVVLVDAEPVAAWRTRTVRGRLTLHVEPLPGAGPVADEALHDEAERVLDVTQ